MIYDKAGNRPSCQIDDADAHVYTYDELYQLTAVDYNDGNSTSYYMPCIGRFINPDIGIGIASGSSSLIADTIDDIVDNVRDRMSDKESEQEQAENLAGK